MLNSVEDRIEPSVSLQANGQVLKKDSPTSPSESSCPGRIGIPVKQCLQSRGIYRRKIIQEHTMIDGMRGPEEPTGTYTLCPVPGIHHPPRQPRQSLVHS